MHGIYFGSQMEIELAHNEGFLFELFKDTGLYNMPIQHHDPFDPDYEEYDDDDDDNEDDDDYEEEEDYTGISIENEYINDDEDTFAIDKVAKFNIKKINTLQKHKQQQQQQKQKTSQLSNGKRTWDYSSLNECNSDYSSLYSLNKQSYCQNYIDNNPVDLLINKPSVMDETTSNNNNNNNKENEEDDNNNLETSSEFVRKITPPGEILATINKWALRTKEAIESRNKHIIKKNNF